MPQTSTIVLFGADEPLGQHIASMAVSLGHTIYSLSKRGRAPTSEPWTRGVTWIKADPSDPDEYRQHLQGADVIIFALPQLQLVHPILETARELNIPRLVFPCPASSTHCLAASGRTSTVILALPRLVDKGLPGAASLPADSMRVETAAMATLRASLEPQHQGLLDVDAVAHLGDAVMIQ